MVFGRRGQTLEEKRSSLLYLFYLSVELTLASHVLVFCVQLCVIDVRVRTPPCGATWLCVHSFGVCTGRMSRECHPAKGHLFGGAGLVCYCINFHNCSYECNISYGNNVPTILHQFLKLGTRSEACFAGPTGCPSIALPLGAAHPFGDTQSSSISDR